MQELRYNEKEISDENKASQQYEAELTIKAGQKGSLYLAANDNLTSGLKLDFDTENGTLILDRSNAGQKFLSIMVKLDKLTLKLTLT